MSVEEKINDFTTNANLLANDYSPSKYVKLNVGGCLFQTTLLTDNDGWILIDRCGKHFGTILNFLRDGSIPRPDCCAEIMELMAEAKFFLIQNLVQQCQNWLDVIKKEDIEPVGICKVPIVCTKKGSDLIVNSTAKPVIKLLINRHNNKYSYTVQSDDNLMKNLELFDRLLFRFNERILFIKDVGAENSEVCQWTFYGQRQKKAEVINFSKKNLIFSFIFI
ncbi:unnamed protein product [Dracunculus medinensis]|uniref:BTB domain-containing protein n=1 Tax=Dracunculus medinensis TaxID=318479 RepID=A0A158Q548_DRAME|nr:unnamed protein product [Dracunculus medinensis]